MTTTNAPERHYPSADDFLMGSSVPSASFPSAGSSVTGTITEQPVLRQQNDYTTGEPKTWEDGSPMLQLVVTLQTDERDAEIEDDDGRRRIYVKSNMKKAVADAVRKAGAKNLQVGGKLTVKYIGDGEPSKKGMQPPKKYEATYASPSASFLNSHEPGDGATTNGKKPVVWQHFVEVQKYAADQHNGNMTRDILIGELKAVGINGWNPEHSAKAKAVIDEWIPF